MKTHSVVVVALVFLAMTSNGSALLNRDRCREPMTAGRCFGYVPSFAYDSITGKCEQFIYGGCDGNENRFDNMKECEKSCRGV